jgi:glyoxylate reductase
MLESGRDRHQHTRVLTDATAEIAIALILMSTRRLGEGERLIRTGSPWRWDLHFHLGTGLFRGCQGHDRLR